MVCEREQCHVSSSRKGKPLAKEGRKATGLSELAGPPKCTGLSGPVPFSDLPSSGLGGTMRRGIRPTNHSDVTTSRLFWCGPTAVLMAAFLVMGLVLQGTVTSNAQASTSSNAVRPAPVHIPTNPTVPPGLKSSTRLTKDRSGFEVTPAPAAKPMFYKGASSSSTPNASKTIHKVTGGGPVRPKDG